MAENRFTVNFDMSESDLIYLQMALESSKKVKSDILRFYEDNPSEVVITPLNPLKDEISALDRLLHIFRVSSFPYQDKDVVVEDLPDDTLPW